MARILIVDDDSTWRMPFSHHLRDQGHEVLCAPDGLDARELLDHHPDLMLLDLVMPGVDGVHLLGEMRKGQVSACPVIVVSEDTTPSTRQMLADFGVEMFIAKPGLTPDTLIDRVQRTLKKKRATASTG